MNTGSLIAFVSPSNTTIPSSISSRDLLLIGGLALLVVIRFLFPPKGASRRLLVFGLAFAALVIAVVLTFEQFTVHSDWIRLTIMALWVLTFGVVLILQRKRREVDSSNLLLFGSLGTAGLAVILFGIQRLNISYNSRFNLGYLVLLLVVLGWFIAIWLKSPQGQDSDTNAPQKEKSR